MTASAVASVSMLIGAATFGTQASPAWLALTAILACAYARLLSALSLGAMVAAGSAISATFTQDRDPEAWVAMAYPICIAWGAVIAVIAVSCRRFAGIRSTSVQTQALVAGISVLASAVLFIAWP